MLRVIYIRTVHAKSTRISYVVCHSRESETCEINTMLYVIYVKAKHVKLTLCCMSFTGKQYMENDVCQLREGKLTLYVVCHLSESGTWKINIRLYVIYIIEP